jgi:protein-S-isoprenylcysteine O-methyltransferase Ste14
MIARVRQITRKAATALYALLMIEVIIMISPFAFYWYTFYSPTLQALHRTRWTAWLEAFMLPHAVITSSVFLEFFRWEAGPYLFSLGLLGFLVCALQVYIAKLRKKGLVTSGVYRYVRHPQYLSLSLAAIGLLTIWPRMIIFVLFLSMMVAYYFLARFEEQSLLRKYPEYEEYHQRTAMFIPGNPGGKLYQFLFGSMRNQVLARGVCVALFFIIGIGAGFGLRAYTIASAQKIWIPESKTLAISGWPQDPAKFERAVSLALNEPSIRQRLAAEGAGSYTAHLLPLNYGMINMFTDIKGDHQMWSKERVGRFSMRVVGFFVPFIAHDHKARAMGGDMDHYRLVISRIDGPGGTLLPLSKVTGANAKMTAVAVVDIDGASMKIIDINLDPPRRSFWGDITMPMF